MPAYPLPTLGITINSGGATGPQFQDILNSLIAIVQSIFGSDVVLTDGSQDLQLLTAFATAIFDGNNSAIVTYNSVRPTNAVGAGLSSLVKVGGLTRLAGSNSTVVLTVGGTAGTSINNGIVQDVNGNLWDLPIHVVIPSSGTIQVTATAENPGNLTAPAGSVVIYTPVRGWQTAVFAATPDAGNNVETDAALRQRFAASYALPALTPLGAIDAAVANVAGIGRTTVYENQTAVTDGNGVPSHSISAVCEGGNIDSIAAAIQAKKSPGTGTYGSTTVLVPDEEGGTEIPINFFELAEVQIKVEVNITPLNGYASSTADALAQAIATFITALGIGMDVYYNWVMGAATLYGSVLGQTYQVTSMETAIVGNPFGTADIAIAFNAAAICVVGNVTVTVA